VHRVTVLDKADVTRKGAIPVTRVARTLVDVASQVDVDTLEEALDDALRRKLVTLSRLRKRVDEVGHRGRLGVAAIRRLMATRVEGERNPDSLFERRILRMIAARGLPDPERQHVVKAAGRRLATVDLAYPDIRLAIEADGYRYHAGRRSFVQDRARLNALVSHGWRVVHATWEDLSSGGHQLCDDLVVALNGPREMPLIGQRQTALIGRHQPALLGRHRPA
jgi:very-short-patch-repair endonuclease